MKNHPPTRHMYKVIHFAPDNKSIIANKLASSNLEQFQRLIKYPLTCCVLIVPNWPKWRSLNPITLRKMITTGEISFQT